MCNININITYYNENIIKYNHNIKININKNLIKDISKQKYTRCSLSKLYLQKLIWTLMKLKNNNYNNYNNYNYYYGKT